MTTPTLTYPGVYVVEEPSGVRAITGVATSITAFVGRARRGDLDTPVTIHSWAEFERVFGGLWTESTLGYAVSDFFRLGGSTAIIVRVHANRANDRAKLDLGAGAKQLNLQAKSPGTWGAKLTGAIDLDTRPKPDGTTDPKLFNLTITDGGTGRVEIFRNVSIEATSPRPVDKVLANDSTLVEMTGTLPTGNPAVASAPATAATNDGDPVTDDQFTEGANMQANKKGLYALEKAELVNLIVVPPYTANDDIDTAVLDKAVTYATERDAIMLVDPPSSWSTKANAVSGAVAASFTRSKNAAVYFPKIKQPDPLRDGQLASFAPSGAVAGIIARTDATRGVWKAPAGLDASLDGVVALDIPLTDDEIGELNPRGVNCLRAAPAAGHVIWGSRTREGNDALASEWKYLPVRRTALFLKVSLYRGTQWVVFEPNDAPLWAQIRLNVGAFMSNLFRQGAFAGTTPREAFFVKCDAETTTPDDVNLGIVNIWVGFAPLRPAEFVVLHLQQMAGQSGGV